MKALAPDTFFDGRLKVAQPIEGYRYSIDAVLLAAQPRPRPGESVVDLGTGCGIIALILAYRYPGVHLHAVEIQPELVRYARDNVSSNQMDDRICVVEMDMRQLSSDMLGGPVDWIVTNPPYWRVHSGRINPNAQKALARHEINMDIKQLVETSRRLLRTGGRFCTIYPTERVSDLIFAMRNADIEPKWMQCLHSRLQEEGKLVLMEGVKGAGVGLRMASPLAVYDAGGNYAEQIQRMMAPNLP